MDKGWMRNYYSRHEPFHTGKCSSSTIESYWTVMGRWFHIENIDTVWLIVNFTDATPPTTVESGLIDISSSNKYVYTLIYIISER